MKFARALIIIITLLTLACAPFAHAQSFDIQSLERIKREFTNFQMPNMAQPQASSKSNETPMIPALNASAPAAAASQAGGLKLPSAQEVMAKSAVAYIDPDTYILGPGDVLSLNFYGIFQKNVSVTVQPDGTIFMSPIAPIYIEDLTLNQAKRKIHNIMKRYYKNFQIELQLVDLRTFQVEILGEVVAPGTYVATPVMGVCDAISLAGGLKPDASLRNIELRDKRKRKKWRIDIFSWYYMGAKNQNRLLNRKQAILVPLPQQKVKVEGAFKRTGDFEIFPGETVADILKIVEPDTGSVLSEGKITRISGKEDLKVIPVDLASVIRDPKSKENMTLMDGDSIFVPDLTVFLKKVTVIGELKGANLFTKTMNRLTGQEELLKIGLYNLKEGQTVKDLVIDLGGITASADMEKARVERPLEDGRVKVIPVDLRKLLYQNDKSFNIALQPGDFFIVPAQATNIYIVGEVRSPGAYQYNVGNKIKEYIALAGGPTRRARVKNTKVIQTYGEKTVTHTIDLRSILTGNQPETFELRAGDVIYVPYADVASYRDIVDIVTDLIVLRQLFK